VRSKSAEAAAWIIGAAGQPDPPLAFGFSLARFPRWQRHMQLLDRAAFEPEMEPTHLPFRFKVTSSTNSHTIRLIAPLSPKPEPETDSGSELGLG
jgi:hypothetical protein